MAGDWTATRGEKFDVSLETPSRLKSGFESSQSAQSTTVTSVPSKSGDMHDPAATMLKMLLPNANLSVDVPGAL